MSSSRSIATLALFAFVACSSGEPTAGGGETGGTLIIAGIAEPAALAPPTLTSLTEKQIVDQLFDYLADIGPELNTVGDKGWIPRLADSWKWSADSMSIAFHIHPNAKWHDGQPVRAADIRFSMEVYKDPKTRSFVASSFDNIDSVSISDSSTAVVWFRERSPEQFFQIAYAFIVSPEHLLRNVDRSTMATSEFAKRPIGSGPFRFAGWTARQAIEIVADTTYYRGRPKLDRVIWTWNPDPGAAATKVMGGEADLLEMASLDMLSQLGSAQHVRTLPYRSLGYGYLLFNLKDRRNRTRPNPLFGDRALRMALSKALDRDAMRKNFFDSLGVVALGPFPRALSTADTTVPQIGHDSAVAAQMLDSLGWRDANGDGIRERNGVPLRFSLMAPTSSASRLRYAVLIQEQLRRVGVQVDVDRVDISVMMPRAFAGQFDALLNAMSADPAASAIRQAWRSGPPDGGNFGGYANPRVDAVLDSAVAESDITRAQSLYRRAYRLIAEDVPAVWLYEPRNRALIHSRVRPNVEGSDFWWRDMRLWYIPAGERIDRDRIGLVASSTTAVGK